MSTVPIIRLRCSQNSCRSGRIPCPCEQACAIPEQEPKGRHIRPQSVERTQRVIYGSVVALLVVIALVALVARLAVR